MIKIQCTYKCFEGIATHVTIVLVVYALACLDAPVESYLYGKFVESLTAYYLCTGIGEESFSLAWEMMVHNVSNGCIEYGITEKFKSLVVPNLSTTTYIMCTAMHHCLPIIFNIVWQVTCCFLYIQIKLLILSEKELYSVYKFITQHTS